MQILLSCAKEMTRDRHTAPVSLPAFGDDAARLARDMERYTTSELQLMLGVSQKIAAEVRGRYALFGDNVMPSLSALTAYRGVAFRQMAPELFSGDDLCFAQRHLLITSFLYGLLRPLDAIHCYRLEGSVRLPATDGETLFHYWQPRLTGFLTDSVKADDGILINLASAEMKQLFRWADVERSITVVTPAFMVRKAERLTMPSVHAKKCRGAMTSWIIRNRLSDPAELRLFSFDGFSYSGDDDLGNPVFIR